MIISSDLNIYRLPKFRFIPIILPASPCGNHPYTNAMASELITARNR